MTERRKLHLFRGIHPAMEHYPGPVLLRGSDRNVRFANRFLRERFGDPEGRPLRELLLGRNGHAGEWDPEGTGPESAGEAPPSWTGPLADGRTYTVRLLPFTEADGSRFTLLTGTEIRPEEPGGAGGEAGRARDLRILEEMVVRRTVELADADRKARDLLARERAARAEAEEGSRVLEALMENVPEGLAIADAFLRFRRISRSMADLVGKPPEILRESRAGEHASAWGIFRIDHKPLAPESHPLYRAIRFGETVRDEELVIRRPDGREVSILSAASPIRDREGNITGGVATWRDITGRKRAEEALRRSEERFRTSVESMQDGFILLSPIRDEKGRIADFRIEYVNESGCRMNDIPMEAHLGKTALQVYPGIVQAGMFAAYVRVAETGEAFSADAQPYAGPFDGREVFRHFDLRVFRAGGNVAIIFRDVTERKALEDALQKEQARLRTVVETMPVGVWVLDPEGRVVLANEAARRIWGGARYVGIGDFGEYRGWWPGTGRRIEPQEWSGARAIRGGETSTDEEIRIEAFDGVHKTILVSASPIRDASGNLAGAVATNVDITGIRRTEQALRESEELLRQFVEHAPVALAMFDRGMRYLYASRLWRESYGLGDRDMRGVPHYEVFPDLPDSWKELHRRGLAGETMRADADRLERADGRVQWIRWEIRPWHAATGEVGGIVIFNEDVTEQKEAGQALRESEERFRRAILEAPVPIMLHAEGEVLALSSAWTELTGYTMQDIPTIDAWAGKAYGERKGEVKERIFAQYGVSGRKRFGEMEVTTARGERRAWDISTAPLGKLPDGRDVTITMAMDVTGHRLLEEQLRHSQRLESVGRLAGGVAHEFNNLLTVVNGYAEMLLSRLIPESPEHREAEQIRKAGMRAAVLTHQLLAFGRKQMMKLRTVDLGEELRNMDRLLARMVGEQVRVETDVEPGLWKVRADPGLVEQVILNLALNARDAMPGGGSLVIAMSNVFLEEGRNLLHEAVSPGPYVRLSVRDTGVGMDEKTRQRVFEPFFTTKEQGKGTGLGLSTVYGIVKQSGGHIGVESEPGRGTTFDIFLPKAQGTEAAAEPETVAEPTGGHETILLAEDEDAVRELARDILRSRGYTVLAARNAEEALRAADEARSPIHLLLTDVVMPGMGGTELAEEVKLRRSGTRVLFMSGYMRSAAPGSGEASPGEAFLQKPFSTDDLARKVREVLDAA